MRLHGNVAPRQPLPTQLMDRNLFALKNILNLFAATRRWATTAPTSTAGRYSSSNVPKLLGSSSWDKGTEGRMEHLATDGLFSCKYHLRLSDFFYIFLLSTSTQCAVAVRLKKQTKKNHKLLFF